MGGLIAVGIDTSPSVWLLNANREFVRCQPAQSAQCRYRV